MSDEPDRRLARLLRILGPAEDAMHALVALLLVGLAIGLLGDTVADVVRVIRGQRIELPVVLAVLDQTLVLFIVAELLHTVRIMVLTRFRLDAEPFLVVGMIAGVRQVLIVTAESEVGFRWNPEGIQLTILIGLILGMALAILVWRRATRQGDPEPFDPFSADFRDHAGNERPATAAARRTERAGRGLRDPPGRTPWRNGPRPPRSDNASVLPHRSRGDTSRS